MEYKGLLHASVANGIMAKKTRQIIVKWMLCVHTILAYSGHWRKAWYFIAESHLSGVRFQLGSFLGVATTLGAFERTAINGWWGRSIVCSATSSQRLARGWCSIAGVGACRRVIIGNSLVQSFQRHGSTIQSKLTSLGISKTNAPSPLGLRPSGGPCW